MYDIPISKMNDRQLREAVQLLYDEFAVFKRKYEDEIHNLDIDNLGRSFTLEQNNMKAQIKITADAIKTMVSDTDLEAALSDYSTITQTANAIKTVVSKGANLKDAVVIPSLEYALDTSAVYVIRDEDALGNITGERYYYYNDLLHEWAILSGDSIYTVFNQTASGFELKGNVVIDGSTVITKNLVLSGNVTWDMENSPVLTQYSSDGLSWHSPMDAGDSLMKMSFDGGVSWSTPTKVVGTDGKDGIDGTDAEVTPENVFDVLTNHGENQGIFAAFVDNGDKLYINSEYLATKIADVSDILYVGDSTDVSMKRIIFSDGANISTFLDGLPGPYTGLSLSASTIKLGSKIDLTECNDIDWGNNAPVAVFG